MKRDFSLINLFSRGTGVPDLMIPKGCMAWTGNPELQRVDLGTSKYSCKNKPGTFGIKVAFCMSFKC
jgi:hypothetical protein